MVGAAGAGASAAALVAAGAGASVSGCDPGGPSPYTPALEALGIAVAGEHAAAHVTTPPRPDRLAVTKALTAIDPDQPELAAARAAGIPVEPWQQVVADAAVGRTLVAIAGTHGKSTTAGWLVHALVAAGTDPSAFVGALLPSALTGGPPATARVGAGPAFVVEADEYAGNFDAYRPDVAVLTGAEWDHPDVFADRGAVTDAFEAWLRGMADGGTIVVNVGDPGAELVADRLRERRLHVIAYALADTSPGRGGYLRGVRERFETAAGPATALLGRIVAADPDGTTIEVYGLDELAGARRGASRHGRAGTTPPTRWRSPGRRRRSGSTRPGSRPGWPGSRGSGDASSARARPPAWSSTTITATTRRPSARPWRPFGSESPAGASGPSTSR